MRAAEHQVAGQLRATQLSQTVAITVLRAYQYGWSSRKPGSCRYVPSCSEYAVQAVDRFGLVLGGHYALRRLLRCAPWGASGFDPIPDPAGSQGTARPAVLVDPSVAIVVSQTG